MGLELNVYLYENRKLTDSHVHFVDTDNVEEAIKLTQAKFKGAVIRGINPKSNTLKLKK